MKNSKAKKNKKKIKKIYKYYDGLLKKLENCYVNNSPFSEFSDTFARIVSFTRGCYLADGYKWYKRLNARFDKWMIETEQIRDDYYDKRKEEKKNE